MPRLHRIPLLLATLVGCDVDTPETARLFDGATDGLDPFAEGSGDDGGDGGEGGDAPVCESWREPDGRLFVAPPAVPPQASQNADEAATTSVRNRCTALGVGTTPASITCTAQTELQDARLVGFSPGPEIPPSYPRDVSSRCEIEYLDAGGGVVHRTASESGGYAPNRCYAKCAGTLKNSLATSPVVAVEAGGEDPPRFFLPNPRLDVCKAWQAGLAAAGGDCRIANVDKVFASAGPIDPRCVKQGDESGPTVRVTNLLPDPERPTVTQRRETCWTQEWLCDDVATLAARCNATYAADAVGLCEQGARQAFSWRFGGAMCANAGGADEEPEPGP